MLRNQSSTVSWLLSIKTYLGKSYIQVLKKRRLISYTSHPFADGCERIGVTIFLEFLNKNHHLIIDGKQIISDSALVAITLMIAESRPEEKETMVKLVMNFLVKN